ncbi:hypothetical protein HMPREF9123_0090 [Neisseria bacilliformis ATCC BAA-1200]|uniref:Uncharacterized protein n=1 Tax=Neisseria bacilliformis ATCC BAA-1200 TaxID=888742 RepID=F2B8N7_9NEIS|nr:hypothetical protein HMPREF9123_0090 [Neisseria bacilliformis ATCC BAA-1200]
MHLPRTVSARIRLGKQVFSDGLMRSGSLKKPVSHVGSRFTVLMQPLNSIASIRGGTALFQPFSLFSNPTGACPCGGGLFFLRRPICFPNPNPNKTI